MRHYATSHVLMEYSGIIFRRSFCDFYSVSSLLVLLLLSCSVHPFLYVNCYRVPDSVSRLIGGKRTVLRWLTLEQLTGILKGIEGK